MAKSKLYQRNLLFYLGLVVGIVALGLIITYSGYEDVINAFEQGGPEILLITFLYPLEIIPHALAWKLLFPGARNVSNWTFLVYMWISQSINRLLPTATIGGDVVRGRLLALKGEKISKTFASLIADKTSQAVSILVILIIGLVLIISQIDDQKITYSLIGAVIGLAAGIGVFIKLQRSKGISGILTKLTRGDSELLGKVRSAVHDIESYLERIYATPGTFMLSALIRVGSNLAISLEIWFAAWLMDAPISMLDAVILRFVSFGLRSMAFIIWGGLGVQEVSYALLAGFVGLPPATLIAISLATRVREIVVGLPGIFAWLAKEGVHAHSKQKSKT
ncbi:MAG TPA: flippase-like domain-containing protein [Cyclobacteriaceae bacterium]